MIDTLFVGLFGGPGCGKSTTAAGLFYLLKKQGISCELVDEYAKLKCWLGDDKTLSKQFYVSAKQVYKTLAPYGQVKVVITDSPFILGNVYGGILHDENFSKWLISAYKSFNWLNILLERQSDQEFDMKGRIHSLEESLAKDEEIRNLLTKNDLPFTSIPVDNESIDRCYQIILNKLNKKK
jgi:ABC-type dipeptide/oligopeptide/nickel transport system ATPase subunit